MGVEERENLITAHLETLSGLPSIQYPNEQFDLPSQNETYLQVYFTHNDPIRLTHGGGHIEEGMVMINVFGPLARHERSAQQLAEQIQAHFGANDLTFAGTGENTRIKRKPHVATGRKSGPRWMIPITIYYQTLPG